VNQKRRIYPSEFLGVTPAPQYSLKVATYNPSVKAESQIAAEKLRINPDFFRVHPCYFTSTVAPASDSFCLIVSASSFETPSFTALGAASTRSLASFNPSAVTSRTTLITLILLPPIACRITSNSVFSSAAAAASPPPPAAATGAATAA